MSLSIKSALDFISNRTFQAVSTIGGKTEVAISRRRRITVYEKWSMHCGPRALSWFSPDHIPFTTL
jgi:hypothetical protein